MQSYIAYKGDRIIYCCEVDEATAEAIRDTGVNLQQGSVPVDSYYMVGDVPTPRPQLPVTLEGLRLSGLPAPCVVHINDQPYECDDSTVELEFDQPGVYNVRVECWPYLDKEFTVEVETL